MPKIIPNLKETLIETAKFLLQNKGYGNFTIHQVAKECNIAMGTMYNYFPSKQVLIANVVLIDWNKTLKYMSRYSLESSTLLEGIQIIYVELGKFIKNYEILFFSTSDDVINNFSYFAQHKLLVEQISKVIKELEIKHNSHQNDILTNFIAENIITYCTKRYDFILLVPIFSKIIS